jgi:uncharacterized protein
MSMERKFEILDATLGELLPDGLVIAFSGGVDSAFLLWATERARRARGIAPNKLLALTAVSASMATTERDDARRFAEELGVEHRWEESREFENPAYAANDSRRCYHCKSELFKIAGDAALAGGQRWLAYGYNASDRGDFRPGHQAATEQGVLAPLADAGLEKDEIRALMRANNLNLAEKPASPCLSSRLMTGVAVTPEKLADVEAMESLLRTGGLKIFRVRLHEEGTTRFLRLEVAPEEMEGALRLREALATEGAKRGYRWVTLDLAGYRMGGGRAK